MRLIDADKVLETMRNTFDMQEVYLPINFIDLIIDEMPTVNQWIPCSERVPELDRRVLVVTKHKIEIGLRVKNYFENYKDECWISDDTVVYGCMEDKDVIA